MPASEDTLALLRSIDASLKVLVAQSRTAATPRIASDRELDGQYGNPPLKFMPRDWSGPSFKGCRFSECPAELLDLVAETFEYFARKAEETGELANNGKPVAPYKRMDAAKARGWAKRRRENHPAIQQRSEDAAAPEPDPFAPDRETISGGETEWPDDLGF